MKRWKFWIAIVVVSLTATACGGSSGNESASGETTGPYEPTATPSEPIEMTDPPSNFREVEGAGFTINAPAAFQEKRKKSSNGEPMLWLETPSEEQSLPQRVAVIRDVNPDVDAAQQSHVLEAFKTGVQDEGAQQGDQPKGPQPSRIAMPAGEGQSAYLVRWVEEVASAKGGAVPATYWQLVYQVNESLIINVVALAPTAEFDESEVSRILRTFSPEETTA